MKFLASLAVAASLAGSAAAAAASAPVYLLQNNAPLTDDTSSSTAKPISVPRQIARQILLQRLGATDGSSFVDTLPRGYSWEEALALVQQFDTTTAPALFEDASSRPNAMLVVVEGAKPEHVAALEAALPARLSKPAFTIDDPPSQAANTRLFVDELAREGIAAQKDTAVAGAVADGVPETWQNGKFVGLYDAKKDAHTIDALVAALPQILSLVESGAAEVALVLLPEASRHAKSNAWAETPRAKKIIPPKARENLELRVRAADFESVIVEDDVATANAGGALPTPNAAFIASAATAAPPPTGPIPACFQSFNSCIALTGSCSNHGTCVDKYAVPGGGDGDGSSAKSKEPAASCFVCHCFSTLNRPEDSPGGLSTTHWAGNMCQKKDVSVPFWLITGFTVTLVGAVSFAVGLLFSVGEEKLPGVIGAGVSRTK